ncbi:hypothetical protein HIM_06964 [Hirsutella minnesotensis 3608]|uniref:DUF7053 domain-containing protein n=1 Tax=Hirsutella minnesotensis 3608 TaxID=1043627 RepID=A0A0F7ZID8_9HYPO|nr:hypothetical protein HIM_06964 [Hirsutella minnesotensis 3608]
MFSASASLRNSSPIPNGVTAEKATSMLQNHEFFIQCDPHMVKYELVDTPSSPEPVVPEGRCSPPVAPPRCYRVTDKVHALPAGLWDSDVVSTYEFINIDRGCFVRIRSPMSTVLETVWQVEEAEDGELVLVEDVLITCSRFVVGIVKSTCENGWKGIHAKLLGELQSS